jgi:hypothetical protein
MGNDSQTCALKQTRSARHMKLGGHQVNSSDILCGANLRDTTRVFKGSERIILAHYFGVCPMPCPPVGHGFTFARSRPNAAPAEDDSELGPQL